LRVEINAENRKDGEVAAGTYKRRASAAIGEDWRETSCFRHGGPALWIPMNAPIAALQPIQVICCRRLTGSFD
jgi:hypothetical protein